MAAMSPFPGPCSQARYCWPQLTGTDAPPLPAAEPPPLCADEVPWFPETEAGASGWLHAAIPATAAPAVARAMRVTLNSIRSCAARSVHDVDPVVGCVEGVRRERVTRAVSVDAAAGQGGQQSVGHRRGEPVRCDCVMARVGLVRDHV